MRFVVAATPNGSSPGLRRYLSQPVVAALPWQPRHHVQWSTPDDRVHVAAWSAEDQPPVSTTSAFFTATAGSPRPARQGGAWARRAVETIQTSATQADWHPHDALADAYAFVALAADGTGMIANDPLGIHPLYRARTATAEIIGNRVDLVAATAERMGGAVPRADLQSAAWLSFSQQIVGTGTGVEGVRTTPQHAVARIAGGAVEWTCNAAVWAKDADPAAPPADPGDVADELDAAIVAALQHAIATQAEPPTLTLTGGKDSRVLLACAHAAGLSNQLRVGAYGPHDLPDMVVARGLCAALGIEFHDLTDEHYGPAVEVPPTTRFARHVHRSSGTSYCGDANEPPTSHHTVISGIMGEIWRTATRDIAATPVADCEEATALFERRRRFNQAGLIAHALDADLRSEARTIFRSQAPAVRTPHDLHQAYLLHMRWPRWFGPLVDLNEHTIRPFYDPRSIRAAFAMELRPRTAEAVHRRLISRNAALESAAFANDEWRAAPAPAPTRAVTGPATARHYAPDPSAPSATQTAVQDIVRTAAPDNQLYDIVDRSVLVAAADRFDVLRGPERGQVLGAVTGLLWISSINAETN